MKTLNNWFTRYYDRYKAPCFNEWCVAGELPSGKVIKTSAIQSFDGTIVTTENGLQYKLLKPDPKWLELISKYNYKENYIQQVYIAVNYNFPKDKIMYNPNILSITETQEGCLVRAQKHPLFGGEIIERIFHVSSERMTASIAQWHDGTLIQDAMPNLSDSEREFFITGLSDEEYFGACDPE